MYPAFLFVFNALKVLKRSLYRDAEVGEENKE